MPSASVLVPFRSADPHRQRVWSHLKQLWAEFHPELEIVEGSDHSDGPWRKALAWRDACERASGDIVVFCDADCWLPSVSTGILDLECGSSWVQAQNLVLRLSRDATEGVLGGLHPLEAVKLGLQDDEPPRHSTAGVGTILWRKDALDVPLDPRFEGWGWEDTAWFDVLQTLIGHGHRLEGSICVHHWHEPQNGKNRTPGGANPNWQLRRRYARACGDKAETRALLLEF